MANSLPNLITEQDFSKRQFFQGRQINGQGPHSIAHSNMGLMTGAVFNGLGQLVSAVVDGLQLTCTYDSFGNLASRTYAGATHIFTWALQADGAYHCISIVEA